MSLQNVSMPVLDACCTSCASTPADAALPSVCTLGGADFNDRVDRIRALAARSLRQSERSPLSLHLTYDADALSEVEELVAAESECCAFLGFVVKSDERGVHLRITAPESAALAANELFDHFAPDHAGEPA